MNDDTSDRQQTFDALFASEPDPWGLETTAYEATKRRETLAMLFPDRFGRALEVGCAIGVLTVELADVCDSVLAIDVSTEALQLAASRLADLANVSLAQAEVPRHWPQGTFDLIVFSEILYFLSSEEIAQVSQLAWRSLADGGVCLLVNWIGPNDLPVDGDNARTIFAEEMPWLTAASAARPMYCIHRLHKILPQKNASSD
ncbi:class I SAM-dependent DNA methyltransferase [Qipengyuania sp. MTN3-11]|uniref:class I SAM-dependent DNA methyltransferase n=1 Tax=Qipengyuania sp. MTN3-11 TaxID=3056557 RepID=UPI0036F37CA0